MSAFFFKKDKQEAGLHLQDTTNNRKKEKNIIVDEDGFQQVVSKKNTRRNIFDKGTSMTEVQQAIPGRPGENHTSRVEPQTPIEGLGTPTEPLGGQGTLGKGTTTLAPLEVITNRQREESVLSSEGLIGLQHRNGTGSDTNQEEGRGDPTSTMLWSPEEICGNKRTLAERSETDDEADECAVVHSEEEEAAEDEEEEVEAEEGETLGHRTTTSEMELDMEEEGPGADKLRRVEGRHPKDQL